MTAASLLAAVSAQMLSVVKVLLMFATFVPWAWLVSSKLDKDARLHHLKHRVFNAVHLASGVAALAAMLLVPIFWVGWPIGIIILAAPVLTYWRIRDQKLPEAQRFTLSGRAFADRLVARKQSRATHGAMLRFADAEGDEHKVPLKDDPRYPIHIVAEDLISPALEARATQIDLAVGAGGGTASQTIDGIRYKREPIPRESAMPLVDYLKGVAGLNVEDRRRRQTADFRMITPTGSVQLSLLTAGSSSGVELRILFDRAKRLLKPFDGLGLLPSQLEALRGLEETHERHGVILIGAPAGHGLTTSRYSFVARHDAYTSNIKTLEREVLVEIDGVDQVRWDPDNPDVDYATNLQSILRRDPDVVLVAEMADGETARTAAEPGMQGPLIYIPLRAATIGQQVREWAKLVGDLKTAITPLRAVSNQRLLRTLCPNCRQPYQPTPEQLQKMSLPAAKVKQLYRASGKVQVKNKIESCPVCGGTGYLGRSGAFEVMVVDDEVRRQLMAGDLKSALGHARRNKMIYVQEAALSKVVNGESTIEEVIRVTAPARKGAENAPRRQADPAPAG
ncbi:MAG: ATPase, T2SS/T4P/T4SS family [Planctomycetota bacterium]|jgi:type II secretory ATPase GspE/PulE/Tfp pilus assembly ATPase PilB-like protein